MMQRGGVAHGLHRTDEDTAQEGEAAAGHAAIQW